MKRILTSTVVMTLIMTLVAAFSGEAQNKYIGVKQCAMCHKTEKQGGQFGIWEKTRHAGAFKTLSSEKALAIAKTKGLKAAPSESPECLKCHTLSAVDPKLLEKSFVMTDGVQCETCHGAGSKYKSMTVMKDHAKAVEAGMTNLADVKAQEALCRTCHNEQSPTFKTFEFASMWKKIEHPVPAPAAK
jgi:nitrate/TMAO reductase-like tetraheme cytochrome c subunit